MHFYHEKINVLPKNSRIIVMIIILIFLEYDKSLLADQEENASILLDKKTCGKRYALK